MYIPIRSTFLCHGRMTKEEVSETLIEEIETDLEDAFEEVDRTRDAYVRFHILAQIYEDRLIAAQQDGGDPTELGIHRQRVLRCYFLFMVGTQLFMDTSSSYTYVAYLRYFSDSTRIHEYKWGATTLAYNYFRLGEGC